MLTEPRNGDIIVLNDKIMIWRYLKRHFLEALVLCMLPLPAVSWAQSTSKDLPQKIASNISELTPIFLHPGANATEFWGTRKYYAWGGNNIGWKARSILPFHQWGQIYDFKGDEWTDNYIATVNWETPFQFVILGDSNIAADQFCRACGIIKKNAFFDGSLDGHRQTFLVTATRQLTSPQPGGDAHSYFEAQPTIITIFAFRGGTSKSDRTRLGDDRWFTPPLFSEVDSFESNSKYCSADLAILRELPITPPPSAQFLAREEIYDGC